MDWTLHGGDADAGVVIVQAVADLLGWVLIAEFVFLLALVALFWYVRRSRRFWCPAARRDVEVEFEELGPPGFRWSSAVRSCSAFDPPTAVTCDRRCVDSWFRRQWAPPPSVRMR